MAAKTGIEWTDHSWNPVRGCSKVSEGCKNCYAMSIAYRFSAPGLPYEGLARRVGGKAEWTNIVRTAPDVLEAPLHWRKPRKIFVNSMSDLFHKDVPFDYIDKVFAIMALCPQHTFQILTKRPERMAEYCSNEQGRECRILDAMQEIEMAPWRRLNGSTVSVNYEMDDGGIDSIDLLWPLPNVWLGTSCENQETADERTYWLRQTPAAVRFISAEPLLGPVCVDLSGIHWCITGGESGSGARPMEESWARSLLRQCRAAEVPFFFKQWGGANKKAAGRELLGREWNEFPAVTP